MSDKETENIKLDYIARELKSWLDWHKHNGGLTGDDHIIYTLPVYPSVGVIKSWIKAISPNAEQILKEPNNFSSNAEVSHGDSRCDH